MLQRKYCNLIEVGCDEAGRGCLAGPLVAAAVILPDNFENNLLDDSKKLSEKNRDLLKKIIMKESISFGIGIVSVHKIDKINVLNASFLAMHRAIEKIQHKYDLLLIDGNRFNKYKNKHHKCIVKGDSKFMSIAAASILAKTHRDNIMKNLALEFPEYSWEYNKGYPTKQHRESIKKFGTNIHHRKSFKLLPNQVQLF